jgi:hypothetical protein
LGGVVEEEGPAAIVDVAIGFVNEVFDFDLEIATSEFVLNFSIPHHNISTTPCDRSIFGILVFT